MHHALQPFVFVFALGFAGAPLAQDPKPEPRDLHLGGNNGPWIEELCLPDRPLVAREAFRRAKGVLDGWWTTRDPGTGLLPRQVNQPVWAPADNAADLLPFLFLAARFTEPERVPELLEVYSAELRLTTRLGWLPDWYSIAERRFRDATPDVPRIIFGATEYAKDGLNPLIELDGPGLWQARMAQLLDGVFEVAPVPSDFGMLPSGSAEVNGELLQTLTRFHFLTGDVKYIEWAERLGDAYCLEVLPKGGGLPAHHWDFAQHAAKDDRFSLNDHGNEIVGGLAELYMAVTNLDRPSRARYEGPLRRMFDILLDTARNEDGLWYTLLKPSTNEVLSKNTPDTWGYALAACVTFGMATGEDKYLEAARKALRGVYQEKYLEWGGADSFADSIEGALLLLNRLPEPEGFAWLDEILPRYWAKQMLADEGGNGIVEGWYGDGNYARTALMVAFYMTQGASVVPWDDSLLFAGYARDQSLLVKLSSEEGWTGVLRLDHPRHRDHYRLPTNHPRLNEFPEWFTVEAGTLYRVSTTTYSDGAKTSEALHSGAALIEGLPLALAPGETLRIMVAPAGEAPFGRERGPTDPFLALDVSGGDDALIDRVDLDDGEQYAGETYAWTGRGEIAWTARSVYGPLDATVWLRWGAKGDVRRGVVDIAGHQVELARGGHDGFAWVPVHVPREWWDGNDLAIRVRKTPSGDAAAFLSAIRVRRLAGAPGPGSSTLRLEAEDLEGPWREQANLPGFTGRGFRVSNAEGVAREPLRFPFEVSDGRYLVWTRGYEGNDQNRSFAVAVDDVLLEPTHRARDGERFDWRLAGMVQLADSEHRLEVRDTGDGFEVVDAVLLTTDPAYDPGAVDRVEDALHHGFDDADPAGDVIAACAASAEAAHAQIASHQGTLEDWSNERGRLSLLLWRALGFDPPPPRTPLRARTVGAIARDGYRVERVVFESRVGFPVTANVYVPDGAGPFPAVLCPVGHWGLSKAQPQVQARCIGFAKQGFLALTYDPFGQGERDIPGNGHDEYFRSVLVGRNNMTYMVWDTVRALDYLLERGDVDGDRIGCTGASGGGLNTLYAAAIDPRIRAAAPVVYVTRLREFLETRITHCPCSHVNGLASFMDMGDVVGMIAPRPVLMVTATQDPSFTPAGARAAADQARGAYELYGAADRLAVREFDTGHDYDQTMREAVYGWMRLHLLAEGDGSPIPEPALDLSADPRELDCFASGRVPTNQRTAWRISRTRAMELEHSSGDADMILTTLRERASIEPAFQRRRDPATTRLLFELGGEERERARVYGTPEGDSFLLTDQRGRSATGPLVVVLTEAANSPLTAAALPHASRVVTFDPRGIGWNRDLHLMSTNSHLLGDPLVFRRARGAAAILLALREECDADTVLLTVAEGMRPSHILLAADILGARSDGVGISNFVRVGFGGEFIEAFEGAVPSLDTFAPGLFGLESAWLEDRTGRYVPLLHCNEDSADTMLTELVEKTRR